MQTTLHTMEESNTTAAPARAGLTFTILWHPDARRIGAAAAIPFVDGALRLSRLAPVFSDGEPLSDPRTSRSQMHFQRTRDGVTVTLPARQRLVFLTDPPRLSADALATGACIGIGNSGVLLEVSAGLRLPDTDDFGLIGGSAHMRSVRQQIALLAPHTNPVLVQGLTGTGKELVSQALHRQSPRARGPLVAYNVAALVPGTAVSQLFGHARGSFTGAAAAASGLFTDADGGTLLLDEIGACSLEAQALLLRALETHEIQPLGGRSRRVDVRVIAATDASLEDAISEGAFRAALYHRLAHGRIQLLPLAGRLIDIAMQAAHHLRPATAGRSPQAPWLQRRTMEALLRHRWPGNSRELRHCCEMLLLKHRDSDQCPPPDLATAAPPPAPAADAAPLASPEALEAVLRAHGYRISETASALKISRNRLKRRMATLELPRAGALTVDQIQDALLSAPDRSAAAQMLRVSEHGLKLRMSALGIQL